jgi:hypothetical protein
MRTVKPCGPDAPTLASSWRKPFPLAMVARKPGHQGERGGNRKTIAQEAPGVPVCLWRLTRVLSTFAHEAMGAVGTRRFLFPPFLEDIFRHNSDVWCREDANSRP